MIQYVFKRYEKKYIVDEDIFLKLKENIQPYVVPDFHGINDVCNIYFDTPDFRIIRASIEKPVFKEKLRLRSYDVPQKKHKCFLELKKKYKGVVYKRRISAEFQNGLDFLCEINDNIPSSQIKNEISYFKSCFENLQPSLNIFYKRQAFYDKKDKSIRITFDSDLLYRDAANSLTNGIFGKNIVPKNKIIMEIKTSGGMPMWLSQILNENKVFPTSFSKYGTAYKDLIKLF